MYLTDFPIEVQWAFFILEKLPDRIDTMNGIYLGKDLTILPFLFDIYQIEYRRGITDLILMIDGIYRDNSIKKAELERKKRDRANKAQAAKPRV